MSELEIPAEVIRLARNAYGTALDREIRSYSGDQGHAETAALIAAAPFLVAAELRRLSGVLVDQMFDLAAVALSDRADELDPEGRTR